MLFSVPIGRSALGAERHLSMLLRVLELITASSDVVEQPAFATETPDNLAARQTASIVPSLSVGSKRFAM